MWDEGVLKNTRPYRMSLINIESNYFWGHRICNKLKTNLIYLFKYKEKCLCLYNQIDIEELTCI